MSKLIILAVIAAAAWWWWRRHQRSQRSASPVARAEDMVRCARCGVHLPRSECVMREALSYCSEEHAGSPG